MPIWLSLYGCPPCVGCFYKRCRRNNCINDNHTASNRVNELKGKQLFVPQNCYVKWTLNGRFCGWPHRIATRNTFSFPYIYVYIYIGFKTFFYVVRHLDSIASYLPTGLHLGFFIHGFPSPHQLLFLKVPRLVGSIILNLFYPKVRQFRLFLLQ
jgi:hypothetical protein